MANPQKENGFTAIANEILQQIIKLPLNGTQWRIICVIWRYTYGFSRKEHNLSISFICEAIGFCKKTQYKQICRELKKLIELEILIETCKPDKNKTRIISFNKNYDLWSKKTTPLIRPVDELDQTSKKTTGEQTASNEDSLTSGRISPVVGLDHQERKDIKINNIYILTPEEQELISNLEKVKGYPLDREKEIEMLTRLKQNYPLVNVIEIVKKWVIDKLDNPLSEKSSPRRQISTWCSNETEWKKKRKVVEFNGRNTANKPDTRKSEDERFFSKEL